MLVFVKEFCIGVRPVYTCMHIPYVCGGELLTNAVLDVIPYAVSGVIIKRSVGYVFTQYRVLNPNMVLSMTSEEVRAWFPNAGKTTQSDL